MAPTPNILLVDDRDSSAERIVAALRDRNQVEVITDPQEALFAAAEAPYDLVVISLGLAGYDALRLCSQLRSLERTRTLPVLLPVDCKACLVLLRRQGNTGALA